MEKLAQLSMVQVHYLKQNLQKLNYKVEVHATKLVHNDKEYKLVGYSEHPLYVNEDLQQMPLIKLYRLAQSMHFNQNRFYPTSLVGLLTYYDYDENGTVAQRKEAFFRTRNLLKKHVYCAPENHYPHVNIVVDGVEREFSGQLTNAVMFNEHPLLGDISRKLIDKVLQ